MLTLMLAGTNYGATMAWIVNRLVTNPQVMERARAEVLSVLDGAPVGSQHAALSSISMQSSTRRCGSIR